MTLHASLDGDTGVGDIISRMGHCRHHTALPKMVKKTRTRAGYLPPVTSGGPPHLHGPKAMGDEADRRLPTGGGETLVA